MKRQPLVTIGIPTHNRAADLALAIKELGHQSYKNIEILISDNHSSDTTDEVIRQCVKRDSRIYSYRQKKLVPAIRNFNTLLEKAHGEFFMWASDDDSWDPRYVETIMNVFMKEDERTLHVTTAFAVMDQTKKQRDDFVCSFAKYTKKYLSLKDYLLEGFHGYKADLFYGIYRTQALRSIGGYQNQSVLAASDLMTLHAILCIGRVRFIQKALFVKQEFFIDASAGYRPKTGLRWLYARLYPWRYIVSNLCVPSRLGYLLQQTLPYYVFNCNLIHTRCGDDWLLHLLNFRSTIQLFWTNVPNDFNRLQRRTHIFSGE